MARATATWTDTETTDWAVTQKVREGKFRLQVLQNLEHLAQTHAHDGGTAAGGTMAVADPKAVWYFGAAAGG